MRKLFKVGVLAIIFSGLFTAASDAAYIPPISPDSVAQTTVSVPSATDTVISAANSSLRSLGVFVQTQGAACTLAFDTAAAAGAGLLLGSGSLVGYAYTWGAGDPPPKNAIHIYCTTAATVVVWQGT